MWQSVGARVCVCGGVPFELVVEAAGSGLALVVAEDVSSNKE